MSIGHAGHSVIKAVERTPLAFAGFISTYSTECLPESCSADGDVIGYVLFVA